jgi:Arc/MetJ-type ribon-helix-helix transcriptional regulator
MTLSIELPEHVTAFLQQQAKKAGYKDISEYVAAVLEADHFRKFSEELEEMLEEAVNSPSTPLTDQDFDDIRREGMEILKKRQAK